MTDQNRVGEAIAAKEETKSQHLLRSAEPPEERRDAENDAAPATTADDATSQADTPVEAQAATLEQMPESLAPEQETQAPPDTQNATTETPAVTEESTEVTQEAEVTQETEVTQEAGVTQETEEPAVDAELAASASAEDTTTASDAVVNAVETEEADTPAAPEAAVSEAAETAPDSVSDQEQGSQEQEQETEAAGASFTPVEESEDVRPRRLKDLEVGMELEGRITSIALYGVFVDIGVGRDGLVHISEMSDTRINSPSDLVQIGDTVNVRIKGLDLDARRISLTMRSPRETGSEQEARRGRARPAIDLDQIATMNVGDIVEGTVTGLSSFGAFVDIGVGKDGLVHISELSEGRIEKPEDAVQPGEAHSFKILEIDPEGSRISLSLRRAQRIQKMRELEPGQQLEGTVSGLATFGAFVDIGVGRDGLVHISQISEERVEKVEDVIKVGDPVSVRVLEVDPQSKRISLTMRPEMPEQSEQLLETSVPEEASTAVPSERAVPQSRDSGGQEEGGERGERKGQGRKRGSRQSRAATPQQSSGEIYTTEDEDEEDFSGNATLEDLMNKFGGGHRKDKDKDKDRRRRTDEEEDEDDDYMQRQRQRDVIRRTLRRDEGDSEA